ncbi:MAG: hypothetical protein QXR63_00120 [Candidatus Bathyarchaeia archaeon]
MPLREKEYNNLKILGLLTKNACKHFYLGTCPKRLCVDNPPSSEETRQCRTCNFRET